MILLLSLFSPLVELFPNWYMSWWVPSNGRVREYRKTWLRRVIVVKVVWLPILFVLSSIVQPLWLIWLLGACVFSAFFLRLYVMSRLLGKKHVSNLLQVLPEWLYVVAFVSIGLVLYAAVSDFEWLVPVAIGSIFLGAHMVGRFREGRNRDLRWDVVGRVVFSVGFVLNLYNIVRTVFGG